MFRILNTLCLILFLASVSFGQIDKGSSDGPPSSAADYEARYQERIKLSEIAGVYIPTDLDDAYVQLAQLSPKESLQFYRDQDENEVVLGLFPKLGRWIILNWGFEGGSRMSHYLRNQGVHLPEDMSMLIMRSWHRHLNGIPVDLEGQVQIIQERIALEQAERLQNAKVIQETRRKVDPETRKQ